MELPKAFIEYLLRTMPKETADALIAGLQTEPSVSIRLNPARQGINIQADGQVPWCPEGFYLKERPAFTADPLLHAGCYYVQEASSMFLAHILRTLQAWPATNPQASIFNPQPTIALDLCAAPGGKSTLLRALLPDQCLLVSNEPIRTRCQVLAENMSKWGHPNVVVTQAYPIDFARFTDTFDLILADVPCSGEGMMRKEAEAVAQWSEALVRECAERQRQIVAEVWPALRPGGILIYSTCTFNREEDEDNVEWIARQLGAKVLEIPVETSWGIQGDLRKTSKDAGMEAGANEGMEVRTAPSVEAGADAGKEGHQPALPCYHFLPGRIRGEGFFCAVLQKDGNTDFIATDNDETGAGSMPTVYNRLKTGAPDGSAVNFGELGGISADSIEKKSRKKELKKAKKGKKGLQEGVVSEADRLRRQFAALTTLPTDLLDRPEPDRKSGEVPLVMTQVELSLDDAFRYLRGESLCLPPDTPRGMVQVCYKGQRLGLMKNLGTRANNLYPKEWRIRSTHIEPQSIVE